MKKINIVLHGLIGLFFSSSAMTVQYIIRCEPSPFHITGVCNLISEAVMIPPHIHTFTILFFRSLKIIFILFDFMERSEKVILSRHHRRPVFTYL